VRLCSTIVCAAIAPMLIAAAEPVRLQPSSDWAIDHDENSCRLTRTFGEGKTHTVLQLVAEAPGEIEMLAAGKPLESYTDSVGSRLLPLSARTFYGERVASATNRDPAILWSTVPMLPDDVQAKLRKQSLESNPYARPRPQTLAELASYRSQRLEFAAKVTELEIQTRRDRPVILELGSLGDPIKMLDTCIRAAFKNWGVDSDLEDKIVRRPWARDPGRWFSSSDYPQHLILLGVEAEVTVRLLVDASGNVTKCTSLSHFNAPEFNKITCDSIMRRAHLEPAELADGTKVPSYYTKRIAFRIGQ
jgi:hypothetical protein